MCIRDSWSIMPFVLFVVFIIIYLPLIGTFVMCISQIVTRVIKIVLAFAFAPIPLAIGTWEDGSGTGKRFIMNAVALAFEGMIMILCVHIYALGIAAVSYTHLDVYKRQDLYRYPSLKTVPMDMCESIKRNWNASMIIRLLWYLHHIMNILPIKNQGNSMDLYVPKT